MRLSLLRTVVLASLCVLVIGAVLIALALAIGRDDCQIALRATEPSPDATYSDRHRLFPTRSIRANGLAYSYIEAGKGPLVILLHGFPDNARTWEETMLRLAAEGFRAVAVYNRGYFPTDLPADGDYSVASMANDVLSLIPAFGEKTAILVGQDWGASIAYAAANSDPGAIRKLIVVAIPHAKVIKPSLALARCSPHFLALPFGSLSEWYARRNDYAYIEYLFHYWSPSWSIPKDLLDEVKSDFSKPGRLRAALQYYRFLITDGFEPSKTQLYRKSTSVPTLLLVGDEDIAFRIGMFSNIEGAFSGPFEMVVVPGAGHFLHKERPDIFVEQVLRFLRK